MPPPSTPIPRFELWWADLPHQDGHAIRGGRPVVIIADVPENRFCIVVPLTTNLDRMRFTATHRVEPSEENGLKRASVLLGFQIRYLDRERLDARAGRLGRQDQAILDALLADLLGFGT